MDNRSLTALIRKLKIDHVFLLKDISEKQKKTSEFYSNFDILSKELSNYLNRSKYNNTDRFSGRSSDYLVMESKYITQAQKKISEKREEYLKSKKSLNECFQIYKNHIIKFNKLKEELKKTNKYLHKKQEERSLYFAFQARVFINERNCK